MNTQSKQAKTPRISNKTKLLCFDLETNGLHGEVFAVGAIVMDAKEQILEQFTGRTKIVGQVDPWVEKNVIPAIKDMLVTHSTYKDLRESFWQWYLRCEPKSDYVLVSNGYPVEYRFLLKCQEENLEERYWQHPFPILDLFSLLLQASLGTNEKKQIKNDIAKQTPFKAHNPLDDARVTALIAFESFRRTGKLN